jgi:ABC-type lipoprotein export system ATPase subunit
VTGPVLELAAVEKDYRALRPLRVEHLSLGGGETVAILGIDAAAGEVFVNLATGATLPDRGTVRLFGRDTADIREGTDWLALLDRLGLVSDRAVLLEAMTVLQNLALPFSLEIDPPPADVADRAAALSRDVGLPPDRLNEPVSTLDAPDRVRIRVARAVALDPALLLLEHPTAALGGAPHDPRRAIIGRDIGSLVARRRIAAVAITGDREFASALTTRVLALEAATGRLQPPRRGWFGRRG